MDKKVARLLGGRREAFHFGGSLGIDVSQIYVPVCRQHSLSGLRTSEHELSAIRVSCRGMWPPPVNCIYPAEERQKLRVPLRTDVLRVGIPIPNTPTPKLGGIILLYPAKDVGESGRRLKSYETTNHQLTVAVRVVLTCVVRLSTGWISPLLPSCYNTCRYIKSAVVPRELPTQAS